MDARARVGRPAVAAVGLVALSAVGFQIARSRVGVGLSSDAYSYLAWAERFLADGEMGHTPYDFTAPKPLELAVATLGEALGAPVAVFGTWAVLGYLAAVLAAGALAHRFGGPAAAVVAAVLAATMPALVLAGWAGDATVPFAACVVGAAALAPGRVLPVAALLGVAGLLRPEAWGLAALHAALSWRDADRRERSGAVAAALVPPALWLGFDWIATGDPFYGPNATERFGVVRVPLGELPGILARLIPDLVGWPLVALGLAGFALGLRRRPLDPAVVFPLALALALLLELRLGLIGEQPLGRYGVGLALFLAPGAAIVLARAPGRARLPALAAGLVLCLAFAAGPLSNARDFLERRGRVAGQLEERMAPAVERTAPNGLVATEPTWGGALAVYSDVPRERIVPLRAVGTDVGAADVRAYLVVRRAQERRERRGVDLIAGRPAARTWLWQLYAAER